MQVVAQPYHSLRGAVSETFSGLWWIETPQADLDQWLHHYNFERPHRGYRNMGRRPIETLEAGKLVREQREMKEAA